MIIQNLVDDFYRRLVPGKNVLILCGLDVDALAATRSLISLLQTDYVPYTLKPISSKSDLFSSIYTHKGKVDQFVLINLGSTVDFLNVDEHGSPLTDESQTALIGDDDRLEIFILDSHRPVNLINVFADATVSSKIFVHVADDEIETIPDYNDVFSSDDDDEDDEADGLYDNLARRQEKENRRKLRGQRIDEYEEYTWTGPSTAITIFDLSYKLSKDTISSLWWAIVGITDQWISKKILESQYTANIYRYGLQDSALRLQSRTEHNNHDVLRVEFDQDLFLPLYRHWTIHESLTHALPIASAVKVWTGAGSRKIKELVAQIGMPLTQANEQYHYMEQKYKEEFAKLLVEKAPNFGVKNLTTISFSAQRGFGFKYTAADAAVAINAMLELSGSCLPEHNFHNALEALRTEQMSEMQSGIELGKKQLRAVLNTINSNIEMGTVINAGPFLYMLLKDGNPEHHMFAHPASIRLLATYLLSTFCRAQPRQRRDKIRVLPLLVAAPRGEPGSGKSILCGIPPLASDTNKNPFGRAFASSGDRSKARIDWLFMDQSLIQIARDDLPKFLDALVVEMTA